MVSELLWLSKKQRFYRGSFLLWFFKSFMQNLRFSFQYFKLTHQGLIRYHYLSLISYLRLVIRLYLENFVFYFIFWKTLKNLWSWKVILLFFKWTTLLFTDRIIMIPHLESFLVKYGSWSADIGRSQNYYWKFQHEYKSQSSFFDELKCYINFNRWIKREWSKFIGGYNLRYLILLNAINANCLILFKVCD